MTCANDWRQEKLWPTVKANWMLWPAANWIAFRFLKADWRILYANIIGVRAARPPLLPTFLVLFQVWTALPAASCAVQCKVVN